MNRKVQYLNAHAFVICVSVNNLDSFNNIGKWKDEIKSVTLQAPIFLILTKNDLDGPVNLKMLKDAMN